MEQEKADESNGLKLIEKYGKLFLLIASIITVIWAIVTFFIPIGDVDITVWVQQEIPVVLPQLPEEAEESSLMLTFAGEPISHATILDVKVFNSGSEPIGVDGQWDFTLRSEDGARIIVLGEPELQPGNLDATISNGPTPDALRLQLGLFNPDDSIELRLVIVEPENPDHPDIISETRIPNLKEPFVTRGTEQSRLSNAFSLPILILTVAVILSILLWEQRSLNWTFFRDKTPWEFIKGAAIMLWAIVFLASFITAGLSWLLSRIALFVINNQ